MINCNVTLSCFFTIFIVHCFAVLLLNTGISWTLLTDGTSMGVFWDTFTDYLIYGIFLTKCAFAMTNFRNDYSNIPNDMHGLIVKIYISQSTSINKFIHKIFLLYEWTGKMLICLEDKCTRLIIRYRKLQLSNLIISLNLNLATKLTVCTAKHVRRSFDIVLMSLDAPVFNRCGFVYQ